MINEQIKSILAAFPEDVRIAMELMQRIAEERSRPQVEPSLIWTN